MKKTRESAGGYSLRFDGDDIPLAVPDLAVAAQLLAQPLDRVKDAATRTQPYLHADGTPFYSLHQLVVALGLVEPRPDGRHRLSCSGR